MRLFKSILAFTIVASVSLAAPIQTRHANRALRLIDSICGDTWCEGDYSFKFDKFLCFADTRTCKLYFTMGQKETEPSIETNVNPTTKYQIRSKNFSFDVACRIYNLAQDTDLIQEGRLNNGVYRAITDCINAIQERLASHFSRPS